jgi:pyruvate,orthophosphate dikinase
MSHVEDISSETKICTLGMEMAENPNTLESYLVCSDGITTVKKGETVTIDGTHGVIYKGAIPTVTTGQDADYLTILRWADKYKRMSVLGIADHEKEVVQAMECGADGIGLCQSSNMFLRSDRVEYLTSLLISTCHEERKWILSTLLPLHRADFVSLLTHLNGKRFSISLLDPRVEEFLPKCSTSCNENFDIDIQDIASRFTLDQREALSRAHHLSKSTSRIAKGVKGNSRLWILYPEITEMQVRAILGKNDV